MMPRGGNTRAQSNVEFRRHSTYCIVCISHITSTYEFGSATGVRCYNRPSPRRTGRHMQIKVTSGNDSRKGNIAEEWYGYIS